ncbi:hypothetical protein QBC33DRAFT_540368 [Phialemonium atrogriseum]|uniref:Uncharacterized protein n=1 Tax=Phialemonium atrogriseum TaxID=1093897 RepID=A0AAJ0C3B5_9PEZI|nr:uncharacterized protein QBC33DRAFT_540368 [Phialemonium atrogriseum]KAK1766836.1 hypothetical protein QBC33DRAFT_540368 [Phialemonium atrogriseum]
MIEGMGWGSQWSHCTALWIFQLLCFVMPLQDLIAFGISNHHQCIDLLGENSPDLHECCDLDGQHRKDLAYRLGDRCIYPDH